MKLVKVFAHDVDTQGFHGSKQGVQMSGIYRDSMEAKTTFLEALSRYKEQEALKHTIESVANGDLERAKESANLSSSKGWLVNEEIYRFSLDVYKSAMKQFGSDGREWRSDVQFECDKCGHWTKTSYYILAEILINSQALPRQRGIAFFSG